MALSAAQPRLRNCYRKEKYVHADDDMPSYRMSPATSPKGTDQQTLPVIVPPGKMLAEEMSSGMTPQELLNVVRPIPDAPTARRR